MVVPAKRTLHTFDIADRLDDEVAAVMAKRTLDSMMTLALDLWQGEAYNACC